MKIINFACKIFALVLALGAVVLFFFPFVNWAISGKMVEVTGAELAFAGKVAKVEIAHSVYMLLSFIFAALAALCSGIALGIKKGKAARIVGFVSALISGIIMLVVALSKVHTYTDYRPLDLKFGFTNSSVDAMGYESTVIIIAILLFAAAIIGIVGWLVNDYLEVLASKGQKLTIWKKIKKFFREMWAEIRKIVWPDHKSVIRSSIIVLIICALVGAFIWIVDLGLGFLLDLITKVSGG